MATTVYLSYAHADQRWAEALKLRLLRDGYEVLDIPVMLTAAEALIVVATPIAAASEGVLADIDQFPIHDKPLISAIPPTAPAGTLGWMPHHLALLPFVDFSEDEEHAYTQLKAALGQPEIRSRKAALLSEYGQPDRRPRQIPAGLIGIGVLLLLLMGALLLPASPIPPFAGVILLLGLALLLVWVGWQAVQRREVITFAPPETPLPLAYLEVIQAEKPRQMGARWPLRHVITEIGRQPEAAIRLPGSAPYQCSVVYAPQDDMFYLETGQQEALTTLHDKILQPDKPLPIWNGDLITLNEGLALQFRFGSPEQD